MKVADRSDKPQGLTGSSPLFDNERATITVVELSRYLGVPKKTIFSWTYRNEMPQPLRLAGRTLFVREEIVAWLQSKRRGATQ